MTNDTVQVLVVSVIALAALLVLIRPLFAREKATSKPGGSCANCAAATGQKDQTQVL
jgi:hypothetical protein